MQKCANFNLAWKLKLCTKKEIIKKSNFFPFEVVESTIGKTKKILWWIYFSKTFECYIWCLNHFAFKRHKLTLKLHIFSNKQNKPNKQTTITTSDNWR
jgi:hypothetical protein